MKKPFILVVDEQDHNRFVTVSILKHANYTVEDAKDEKSALAAVRKQAPDLIIIEHQMPGLDEYSTCQHLKTEIMFQHIPVIFVCANTNAESKKQCFAACGTDCIARPFLAEELLIRVKTQLQLFFLQERLSEEIERYRALEAASFYGILIHRNGEILEVSDTLADMAGYAPKKLIGRNMLDFIVPKDHGMVKKAIAYPGEEALNYVEIVRRDGSRIPLEVRARTIRYRGRKARVTVTRDISSQLRLEDENLALRVGLDDRDRLGNLIGRSLSMRRVYRSIIQAASSDEIVVISGETGTGKELAARTIFELSRRSKDAFVPVNCGALQESIFESLFFGHKKGAFTGADRNAPGFFDRADGGVLFLDEISELTQVMQAKLLRALQDGEFTPLGAGTTRTADVRLISAINRKLGEMVANGHMRPDFFQRIHVIPVGMPSLRDHKEDIGLLINYFRQQWIEQGTRWKRLSVELMNRFMAYHWPGNVRELFNELRRYQAIGNINLNGTKANDMTTLEIPQDRTYKELMETFERKVLTQALARHHGNRTRTAKAIAIPRKTLQRKIKKYDL